ncbi:MAG: Gfo/Idh/MocA family protein [Roseibacillus sp.]
MKVGIIGAGHWGKNLVKNFSELGVLEAVADSVEDNLAWVAKEFPEVKRAYDAEALLEGVELDAVAIATPPQTHAALARAAIAKGLDVFVEKPLTLDLQEAEELSRFAQEKGAILMVGHLLMYQPAIAFIKSYLDEGKLGKVFSLNQRRSKLGRVRSVENVLWSFGVHDVAVLLHLIGEVPEKVISSGQGAFTEGVADDVHLHLQFPSGVQANLHNSWYWPRVERELIITGEKGMLVFEELNSKVILHRKTVQSDLSHQDEGEELLFEGESQPLKLELTHFLECCQNRQQPRSDGRSGVEVVKVLNEAQMML